jgi:triosephosphate isomerase|tara:strand:+ start:142 stop:909 length:768 start_codon:yes stop_codon:yes gene_type:complete
MMRNLVAGNWKSNKSINESREWMSEMAVELDNLPSNVKVMIAPPAPYLSSLAEVKNSRMLLASQTVSATGTGAHTGEYTADMLVGCGVDFALVGHSERRASYGETDDIVVDKIARCMESGLGVILCCGESLQVRDAEDQNDFIATQLSSALSDVKSVDVSMFVIAYEPIWAIGTGRTASSEQAGEMHKFIRTWLIEKFGEDLSSGISILYGGSCKPSNAAELFSNKDVDGGLIGGASLNVADFCSIIKASANTTV